MLIVNKVHFCLLQKHKKRIKMEYKIAIILSTVCAMYAIAEQHSANHQHLKVFVLIKREEHIVI